MPYAVPPLPYAYDALEPHIDAETMRIHHDRHHATYVDNLNAAIAGTEWDDGRPIEELLTALDDLPEDKRTAVRNNGGGHANHSQFWESMSPFSTREPDGAVAIAIDDAFGSFDNLKAAFSEDALRRFGSGWEWLVHDGVALTIFSTANQDRPISNSNVPLLGLDVWEHAYYLHYQNRRADYIEAWWNVVDWAGVGERFSAAERRE